jgi:hypothetical protein
MSFANRTNKYGARTGLKGADVGIRRVAPTFGKIALATYSTKADGNISVEGRAERLVSHALSVDPTIRGFSPQPFSLDLVDGQILRNAEARKLARLKHAHLAEQVIYTPDFGATRSDKTQCAIEVKLEGYEGGESYNAMLKVAQRILWEHGLAFKRIVVPSQWNHPLLFNIPLLHQAKLRLDLIPDSKLLERVAALPDFQTASLRHICELLEILPSVIPVLVVHGVLATDLSRYVLRGDAMMELADGTLEHLQFLDRWAA